MFRWLFHLCASLSILLCVATISLWVRSFNISDFYHYDPVSGETYCASSTNGVIEFAGKSHFKRTAGGQSRSEWKTVDSTILTSGATKKSLGGITVGDLGVNDGHMWYVRVSHWWVVYLFAIVPLLWLRSAYRRRRSRVRKTNNQCVACGYSLRGFSGGACPECGVAAMALP